MYLARGDNFNRLKRLPYPNIIQEHEKVEINNERIEGVE